MKNRWKPPIIACLALLSLTLAGCRTSEAPDEGVLSFSTELGVKNPSVPETDLLCAGQLTKAQFSALHERGFATFINLRTKSEEGTGWEAEHAAALGVSYHRLAIAGAAGVTEESARALDALLDEAQRPVVLYCGSSNRVGALYGLAAFYVDGASPDEALERGRAAGLTRLESRVKELLGR